MAEALKPFFKKESVIVGAAKPDDSQLGQPAAGKPSDAPRPRSMLEGLIDLQGTDPRTDMTSVSARPETRPQFVRRGHRAWATAVEKLHRVGPRGRWAIAGALLLGLSIPWSAVIFKADTSRIPVRETVDHKTQDRAPKVAETESKTIKSHEPAPVPPPVVEVPPPFRIKTHRLGGVPFIDPVTFGPNWLGFNEPGTAGPWVTKDAFARLATQGRSATRHCQCPDTSSTSNLPQAVTATSVSSSGTPGTPPI